MYKYIQGTIEMGIPLLMLALLVGLGLSNYWANTPVWLSAIGVVFISVAAIAGFAMLGKPGGMATREEDDG